METSEFEKDEFEKDDMVWEGSERNASVRYEDICIHGGENYDAYHGAIIPPLFQNTLFTRKRVDSGYRYTRVTNPTIDLLETKLAALEGAEAARVFASGMGAITAILCSKLKAGDHVIILRTSYFPVCKFLLEEMSRFGVEMDLADDFSEEELARLVRPNTRLFYLESPSSNVFKILDLRRITAYARARGIVTVMDNTWATPLYQNPLALGIDYVIHSATKYLGGHSDIIGGVVMGDRETMDSLREHERSSWGACMDPFAAWLLLRSLRTLEVRLERHSQSAARIAEFLDQHEKVKKVYYPGLKSHENYELGQSQMRGCSGLMSFVLDTDIEHTKKFLDALKTFEVGPSWGGFESILSTPGFLGPEELAMEGLVPGLLRVSIGLESADTLLEDLEQALKTI